MSTLTTKFRGDISILEKTLRDDNVADDAGIKLYKLEKCVIAADGTCHFENDQSFGGHRATNGGEPVLPDDFATKSYVDAVVSGCEQPADYIFHYLKQTTGPPTGTAIENEMCLNSIDNQYYIFSGGSWGPPLNLIIGDKLIFALSGSDTSGLSGTYTKTNKIYIFSTVIESYFAHNGCVILVRNQSYHCGSNSGWIYDQIENNWTAISGSGSTFLYGHGLQKVIDTLNVIVDSSVFEFNSSDELALKDDSISTDHLKLGLGGGELNTDVIPEGSVNKFMRDEHIDDRVNSLIDEGEGIDIVYDDPGNKLTISTKYATAGDIPSNAVIGGSSFNNESFGVNSGFVSLEKVDGGEWVNWVDMLDISHWTTVVYGTWDGVKYTAELE